MKTTRIITTLAFSAIAILSNDLNAQSTSVQLVQPPVQLVQPQINQVPSQVIQQPVETRIVPEAVILPPPSTGPKLGFTGQIVHGLGMRILSVNYGSPAQRAGLEYGDTIMSANGIQIRCQADLSRALNNAVHSTNGAVNLYVKNIRGCPTRGNQYVTVTAYLFGQPVPAAVAVSTPVVHN